MNTKTFKLPNVIGWRGAASYAPENTAESIHAAADTGCEWVALDIRMTKDDALVIVADETVERTTNGSGAISELNLADLADMEAGSWFADSFAGTKILTLAHALDVLAERDLGVIFTLHPTERQELAIAEAALDVISQLCDDGDPVMLASRHPTTLETIQDMAPQIACGLWIADANDTEDDNNDQAAEEIIAMANHLKCKALLMPATVPGDYIPAFAALQIPLIIGPFDDPDTAHTMQSMGISAFLSPNPDEFFSVLESIH